MGKKQKAGKVNKRIVGKAKNSAENEAEKREEGSSSAQASRPIRPRHKDDKPAVGGTSLVPKGGSDAFEHGIGSSVCGLVNLGNTCYLNSCVQVRINNFFFAHVLAMCFKDLSMTCHFSTADSFGRPGLSRIFPDHEAPDWAVPRNWSGLGSSFLCHTWYAHPSKTIAVFWQQQHEFVIGDCV